MTLVTMIVGVEVERRDGISRWQRDVWQPVALTPERSLEAWTILEARQGATRHFAGNAAITLHSSDTKVLKDNIESRTPSVFVVLRRGRSTAGWDLHLVTADPSEAHAHADVGDDLVEALPMPPSIFARVAAFVARHHVERPQWKRRRDRSDPEALARRPFARGAGDA